MYSGKHARPGGPGGPDFRHAIPRQAGEAAPLNEVSLDDLEAEDALDRNSHDDMHRLLGSIHMRGIRLQSPIYIDGARRPAPRRGTNSRNSGETRQERVPSRAGHRPDDTVPLVKRDTIPLVKV